MVLQITIVNRLDEGDGGLELRKPVAPLARVDRRTAEEVDVLNVRMHNVPTTRGANETMSPTGNELP